MSYHSNIFYCSVFYRGITLHQDCWEWRHSFLWWGLFRPDSTKSNTNVAIVTFSKFRIAITSLLKRMSFSQSVIPSLKNMKGPDRWFSPGTLVFSWYSGFLRVLWFSPRYNWNIVESGIKHHKPNPNPKVLLNIAQSIHIIFKATLTYKIKFSKSTLCHKGLSLIEVNWIFLNNFF